MSADNIEKAIGLSAISPDNLDARGGRARTGRWRTTISASPIGSASAASAPTTRRRQSRTSRPRRRCSRARPTPSCGAQLQNNLAIVYWSRIQGDRAQNVEEAIARFEAALTVITREKEPDRWAAAQNNLANAFGKRLRGEQADNREMAIAHLEAALSVFSRDTHPEQWAQAQNNLAIAYLGRMRGDMADNQEKAIACLQAALTVFTRDATPQLWAQAQHNLGKTYADRIQGERAGNRQKAVASFKAALTVFTRDAAPLDHLRTSRLLGRVLMESGEWTLVAPIHASAREAFLLLFGQGISDAEARALIADAGPLFAEFRLRRPATGRDGKGLRARQRGARAAARRGAETADHQSPRRSTAPSRRSAGCHTRRSGGRGRSARNRACGRHRQADRLRRELFALVDRGGKGIGEETLALAEARRIAAAGGTVVMPVVTDFGGGY